MSQSPDKNRQPPPPSSVDPKFICSVCDGLTIKVQGKRPACYGKTSKQQLSKEGLEEVESGPPMEPNSTVYVLGRSLYSERLHKDNKPPQLISGIVMINTNYDTESTTPTDKNGESDAAPNGVPKTANASPGTAPTTTGATASATGANAGNKANAPPENRLRRPPQPPIDWKAISEKLKKGTLMQFNSMRGLYGDLSANFPERFQRGVWKMYHSSQNTWAYVKRTVYHYVFENKK